MTPWTTWKSFLFKIASVAVYVLPVVIAHFPSYANITLGGLGLVIVNWLENRILT